MTYGLEDLVADDRMSRNAKIIGDRHRAQLENHIKTLQSVLDKLQ